MRASILATSVLLPVILLASCSSPPKPPMVDESRRRPVNTSLAVGLQVCRNDLYNARLQAAESARLAEATATTLTGLTERQQTLAELQARRRQPAPGNAVFTVRFGFGSARVDLPAEAARRLVDEAKGAPLVMLRGRTDGLGDAPAESRVARERAEAVRDYLVTAGVDPGRIRATYQPSGDPAADNASPNGRALNRRVEIEIYRGLPVVLDTDDEAR